MNISEAIDFAADELKSAGVANPRREASSLLTFILQQDTTFLVAHPEYELAALEAAGFKKGLDRRRNREPFQHITGRQEFYGLEFEVNPDVLIPRPETEILVEAAIDFLSNRTQARFCELGVGSGCISISILSQVQNADAVGIDISDKAIAIAAKNASKHGVADRLTLRNTDLFENLSGTFDLIVSNPPYIPAGQIESLQTEVRLFEPRVALSGGENGLEIIDRIIGAAPRFLTADGLVLIEIGFDQAESVKGLFDPNIWTSVEFLQDLQGIPRIVRAGLLKLPQR
jgi:release factor glutamine methyltransferase